MCFLCLTGVVVFTVRGSNNSGPGVLFLHSNVSNRVVNNHPHFADVSGVIFTVTSSNNSSCRLTVVFTVSDSNTLQSLTVTSSNSPPVVKIGCQ